MASIDLVPESYRRRHRVRAWLRHFSIGYGAVIICLVAAKLFLSAGIHAQASEIERLRVDQDSALDRKARSDELGRQRAALEKQLGMLEKLRGGPPVRSVFANIDRALNGRVWFTDWKFMRAGEFVDLKSQTLKSGFFLVLPDSDKGAGRRAWRMHTHMEIRAQAADHSALADFVSLLERQPVIRDVKVLNTRNHPSQGGARVNFELAVVVGG